MTKLMIPWHINFSGNKQTFHYLVVVSYACMEIYCVFLSNKLRENKFYNDYIMSPIFALLEYAALVFFEHHPLSWIGSTGSSARQPNLKRTNLFIKDCDWKIKKDSYLVSKCQQLKRLYQKHCGYIDKYLFQIKFMISTLASKCLLN